MIYDRMRRTTMSGQFGLISMLISAMAMLGGCDTMRPFGDMILGGLETAGRSTVGGLQWVADGGEIGIRGRDNGSTAEPFLLVTGLRYPGVKLDELKVHSMEAVDGKGAPLLWKQGAWNESKFGPALTITVTPAKTTETVDVTGVLIYRGGRWTLSARCLRGPNELEGAKGNVWKTELIDVIRQ